MKKATPNEVAFHDFFTRTLHHAAHAAAHAGW